MKKLNGFTLIELMIVVAIIGILASIATPYMRTMISNSKNNSVSNKLLIDIMYTRNVAITTQTNAQMIPLDATTGAGVLADGSASVGVNWGAGWQVINTANANEPLRRQESFGPDAQVRSVSSFTTESGTTITTAVVDASSPIEFSPEGFAVREGTLEVAVLGCAGDSARRLRINQVGQIMGTDINCPAGYEDQ